MVTAEEVYGVELKQFCSKFGFSFSGDLKIKKADKDVVIIHGLLSLRENGFYKAHLRKSFWMKNKRKVSKLRKKAENVFKEVSGGSGALFWRKDWHGLVYSALQALIKEQAEAIFMFPKYANEDKLKEHMPNFAQYIPQFIPVLKFLAFVKFIYPEWMELIERCKKECLEFEALGKDKHLLPWYWTGEIRKEDHDALLHEAIHNIIRNSGLEYTFERVSGSGHNAWNEGIDVFFHRRSGLYLGGFKSSWTWRFRRGKWGLAAYWGASQIFWNELKDIPDNQLRKVLGNPKDEKTKRIVAKIKEIWPDSSQFHVTD